MNSLSVSLYVWLVLNWGGAYTPTYNWVYMGMFASPAACHAAAQNFVHRKEVSPYQCISTITGKLEPKP